MLEARAFVTSLDSAREILSQRHAILRGEYEIHNFIFSSKEGKSLIEEFLRLRLIPKNIWNEKSVVLAIKNTEVKSVGKNSVIPFKKEFDSEEEARKYIKENLADKFQFDFEYRCIGWQYDLGEDQVDLENTEGHFSIEVKSKTEEELKKLLETFHITETIIGPTVLAMKEILKR